MKRPLTLALCLGIVSPAALAVPATGASRWVVFESMPEGIIYFDPASVVRQGGRADMWVLIDYKQPQADHSGKQILSDTLHYRYDCGARTFTILASSAHAGQMGGGAVIESTTDPKPAPVPSGTTAEDMFKRACTVPAVK